MLGKKGQKLESPTVHVAIFVLVMDLFIIAYLVLLPQAEREELLGTGEEYWPEDYEEEEDLEGEEEILLSVSPGRVYPYARDTIERDLSSVSLYSTTKTKPIMLVDRTVVSRSWLINRYKEIYFDVEDLGSLEGLGLFFNTGDATGDLVVFVNNEEVYRGRVRGGDLPIKIPKEVLKENNNRLILEAAHPGIFILSTNRFTLKDVQLIKQISMVNKVEYRNFVVNEADSLRKGELEFFINCLKVNVEQGILKVGLNGKNLYIGKVVCDAGSIDIDLLKDYFVDGKNVLVFEIDTGEYILEQVNLDLEIESKKLVQYYFSIDDVEGDYVLEMSFEASEDVKRATISVNGENLYLDSYKNDYSKDVSSFVREGENFVKISAKNEFVIDLLEVVNKR